VDVIETVDIKLAAYAMARGGGLNLIGSVELRTGETVCRIFRLEGLGIEEAEIDYVHFGPRGVPRDRLERLAEHIRAAVSRRRL
jgi:hypothetical protein